MEKTMALACSEVMSSLLDMIAAANETAARGTANGEAFTPFTPGLINLDEPTASRVLAMLLNPKGSHGQGNFFLRKFLALLPLDDKTLAVSPGEVQEVSEEKCTYGKAARRRLDIYAETEKFRLGVENKLGAGDQEKQLADYLDWLAMGSGGKPYFLVYFTPEGNEASEFTLPEASKSVHAGRVFNLAWSDLVASLQEWANAAPAKIAYFIKDYCKAIKNLKLREKDVEIKKDVIECLTERTSDEQLMAAAEIRASWQAVSDSLILAWLTRLKNGLTGQVKGEIMTDMTWVSEWKETDYLVVSYPDLYVSVYIMQLGYPHGGVPAYTVSWGEVVQTWNFTGGREEALANPWIKFFLQKLGAERLIGNTATIHGLQSPLDAEFLIRIRKDPVYLLTDVLTSCKNIENWAEEYKALSQKEN